MPDDLDDAWLEQFLEHPERWSEEDLATARVMLVRQQHALDDADPRDQANRLALQEVVNRLQEAIAARRG